MIERGRVTPAPSNREQSIEEIIYEPHPVTPERKAAVQAILPAVTAYAAPTALQSAQEYAGRADLRADLARISAPVLCVYGDKDTIPPARLGEYLRQHLAHARLLLIKKAVHAPFISHPELMAAALKEAVANGDEAG